MSILTQRVRCRQNDAHHREDVMNNRDDLGNIHSLTSQHLCTEVKKPSAILSCHAIEPFYRLRNYYIMPDYAGQALRTIFQYVRLGGGCGAIRFYWCVLGSITPAVCAAAGGTGTAGAAWVHITQGGACRYNGDLTSSNLWLGKSCSIARQQVEPAQPARRAKCEYTHLNHYLTRAPAKNCRRAVENYVYL